MPQDIVYRIWLEREGRDLFIQQILIVYMPGMVLRASDEMGNKTGEDLSSNREPENK